jgi:hypothetical protein
MSIVKINSLGITYPVSFSAGTAALPSITFSGDTNTGVFAPAADTIGFAEGGTEVMRIDSSGNVGINGTPKAYLQPNYKAIDMASGRTSLMASTGTPQTNLLTNAYYVSGGFLYSNTGYGATNYQGQDSEHKWYTAPSGTADASLTFTERMKIDSAGALILAGSTAQKASGTTWSNPSDTRLKDNKQNYTKGLNELLQINVKTWEWNGKAGTTQGDVGIGIIADEIETILPNTIDTYKAKLNEGDIEQTDVKRFDATEITWLLLNSVKEQQAIIEQLKVRLTALESK